MGCLLLVPLPRPPQGTSPRLGVREATFWFAEDTQPAEAQQPGRVQSHVFPR